MEKLLDGRKTIESRWYKVKVAPWDRIKKGDVIYFKNSGELVSAIANVTKVLQFENLNTKMIREILNEYGKDICLEIPDPNNPLPEFYVGRKYCILIFLKNVRKVPSPFDIDKTGYGNAAAWLVTEDISILKKKPTGK